MGSARGTHEETAMHIGFWRGNLKKGHDFKDSGTDGRNVLKVSQRSGMGRRELDSSGWGYEQIGGFCEHGNDLLAPQNGGISWLTTKQSASQSGLCWMGSASPSVRHSVRPSGTQSVSLSVSQSISQSALKVAISTSTPHLFHSVTPWRLCSIQYWHWRHSVVQKGVTLLSINLLPQASVCPTRLHGVITQRPTTLIDASVYLTC